MEVKQ